MLPNSQKDSFKHFIICFILNNLPFLYIYLHISVSPFLHSNLENLNVECLEIGDPNCQSFLCSDQTNQVNRRILASQESSTTANFTFHLSSFFLPSQHSSSTNLQRHMYHTARHQTMYCQENCAPIVMPCLKYLNDSLLFFSLS